MVDERNLPSLVIYSMNLADGMFFEQGNLISPVIIPMKGEEIQEPVVIDLPNEVIGASDIQDRVSESIRSFVYEHSPDEVAVILEGFFMGDGSGDRCISLVASSPEGERFWVARVVERRLENWREIMVRNSSVYSNLYEKAVYRWN